MGGTSAQFDNIYDAFKTKLTEEPGRIALEKSNQPPVSRLITKPANNENIVQKNTATPIGERNKITPNANTGTFSAIAPGGQGIFKDFDSGKTSIKLSGTDGAQFMSDRNADGLNISGNTTVQAKPQDIYSLLGRNPNMTQQFTDLTKPITPQEIEAYRLGKGNSLGKSLVSGLYG